VTETLSNVETLIRTAQPRDGDVVSSILCEAAGWIEGRGEPLWLQHELRPENIAQDVAAERYFLSLRRGRPVGVMRYQLEDPLFWPDRPTGESAYVHRLAVRRSEAGTGVSTDLLRWAVSRTRDLERDFLRLDCPYDRARLRAMYERFGFRHHSDRQAGPYFVARYEYRVSR
jgi:GNAT superfamily N-acetyltransferase